MICRLCGNNNLKLYYVQGNKNQYKFYKCPTCKLVNYDLTTGQDQIKYEGGKYILPEDMSPKQNKDQHETYKFIKKRIKSEGRLLDIGCGNGKLLLLAKNDGWDVKGLELSKFLADSINSRYGIDVAISNFLTYTSDEKGVFDIIILRHVLEHLPDSIIAMTKINELLKTNGYAVLEFPDIEGCELKLKRFLKKTGIHKKRYEETYKPGHCNEFCKESFKYLLAKTGFELLEWQNYSSNAFLTYVYKILNWGSKARVLILKV